MKIKPTGKRGRVAVETSARDDALLEKLAHDTVPFTLKRILVPLDFSECSLKALRYAVPLARQFGASIELLHVVQVPSVMGGEFGAIDLTDVRQQMTTAARQQIKQLLEDRISAEVTADGFVKEGRPASAIVESARESNADLIVIGTHGYTGLKHVLMGSTAESVVRHAACPVLVVRERERDFVC
jgi:universal stress protein A